MHADTLNFRCHQRENIKDKNAISFVISWLVHLDHRAFMLRNKTNLFYKIHSCGVKLTTKRKTTFSCSPTNILIVFRVPWCQKESTDFSERAIKKSTNLVNDIQQVDQNMRLVANETEINLYEIFSLPFDGHRQHDFCVMLKKQSKLHKMKH